MTQKFMTGPEVAELLRISPKTVLTKTRRGEIPGFKVGTGKTSPYRYETTAIDQLITRWKNTARIA